MGLNSVSATTFSNLFADAQAHFRSFKPWQYHYHDIASLDLFGVNSTGQCQPSVQASVL
jgi:hypothetical protein